MADFLGGAARKPDDAVLAGDVGAGPCESCMYIYVVGMDVRREGRGDS